MSSTLRIAVGSILVGLAVLALKLLAWWMTGSVALLSDALESTVNVATALAALIAIRVAAMPADHQGFRVTSILFLRSRVEQRGGTTRAVLLEYRFRLLAV